MSISDPSAKLVQHFIYPLPTFAASPGQLPDFYNFSPPIGRLINLAVLIHFSNHDQLICP
jgi:hypothetical protein